MTEEIINSDGSRKWEANILLDNIKRLEQENKELTHQGDEKSLEITKLAMENCRLEQENKELKEKAPMKLIAKNNNYRSALKEIKKVIKSYSLTVDNGASVDTLYTIRKIINEVLQ